MVVARVKLDETEVELDEEEEEEEEVKEANLCCGGLSRAHNFDRRSMRFSDTENNFGIFAK